MPKTEIDYSNTIIYKITCKDESIKDVYVGHTTNFVQRKHAHKQSCISEKSSNHNCKLYKIIRANGGWDNWTMEIVAFFKCNDHYEARIKEQEYFTLLNASLNSLEPMPKPKPKPTKMQEDVPIKKIYYCETCKVKFQNVQLMDIHNQTKKHLKKKLLTESFEKISYAGFYCEKCAFKTCKKNDWERHVKTVKHTYRHDGNILENSEIEKNAEYNCDCGKKFLTKSGLWKHNKGCIIKSTQNCHTIEDTSKSNVYNKDDLINYLIKEKSSLWIFNSIVNFYILTGLLSNYLIL